MKHFFALPALLRASLLFASASPNTFSVQDDLLAFPQYEVKFVDDFLTDVEAQRKLRRSDSDASGVEQFQRQDRHAADSSKAETQYEHEHLIFDGQRYVCSIPIVYKPEDSAGNNNNNNNDTLSKLEEEKELARATDRGWELLSGMQGNCIYFISGWWSYRFCYGQGVKQFHQLAPQRGMPVYPPIEDPSVDGYELGNYEAERERQQAESDDVPDAKDGDDAWEEESALDVSEGAKTKHKRTGYGELVHRGESRYLVQRLEGGTTCDLTGKPRRVEVQFHCNPTSHDKISLIKETSTCSYLMVVQTPRLCNDVAFLPPQKDQPNAINCSPVLADDEIDDYEQTLKALRSAERSEKVWEASEAAEAILTGATIEDELPLFQVVGDIIVGGHAIVPEDLTIEKGAIVGGGKETYMGTIASSAPGSKVLNAEELKKLGFGDPKAVESLKKELEKAAGDQSWKLDVIDTPRGREYRGIIGDGDKDDDEKGAKKTKDKKQAKAKEGKKETQQQKSDDGQLETGKAPAEKEDPDGDEEEEEKGSEEEYYKEEL
ncbi:Glucosidase II beta subunit-like protein [Teratosphaeria destructans]|uniref:Endoplasmic reticulum lectin n=1 Tax=Teratosphaeria destructans TaxID=418781 RepID=A0A9W7SNG9_9PEZI|nr:Glucosidase II beta subunit-like protein [Teratosphaeria destructans]